MNQIYISASSWNAGWVRRTRAHPHTWTCFFLQNIGVVIHPAAESRVGVKQEPAVWIILDDRNFLFGFTGLTFIAVWTRKNFSFLGGMLKWGMMLALVAIAGGVIFGFELGTWFSVAMIGLAGAAILYDTSKILTVFPTDRHVGAALELFSSVALMFWYVLRLFLSRR